MKRTDSQKFAYAVGAARCAARAMHRIAPTVMLLSLLWQTGAAQTFAADMNDIDDQPGPPLNEAIKKDLDTIDAVTAPPGSRQELAQRQPDSQSNLHPLSMFQPKQLPPEPQFSHAANSVIKLPPLNAGELINVASLPPLEMDAAYSVPMSLREALDYANYNSLAIKISAESFKYQKWQLLGALVSLVPVPSFSTGYSYTRSRTQPDTVETAKVFPVSIRYPVFSGGSAFYGLLTQYYREQGWHQAFRASVNDAIMDVYTRYNNLVLQHVVLRIRAKAVAASRAQLHLNNSQYQAGSGTALSIMQSRTQLASDEQLLQDQQMGVRQAALALAYALNMPLSVNIVPDVLTLKEAHMADPEQVIGSWMQVALVRKPELRQYEAFKLSAARNVSATLAGLYPSASFTTAYSESKTVVNPPGGTVGGVAIASITAAQTGLGTASANALGQTASFSPTGSTTANSGANNTVATQLVAASGGQPLNVVQSGSLVTSGAASPSFIGGAGGGGAASPNINGSNAPGAGVFGGAVRSENGAFGLSWSLTNLGLSTIISACAAQVLANQSALQVDQQLLLTGQQMRTDYVNFAVAIRRIDNTAVQVDSAKEALRLSNLRLTAGTGTNIESIQAQRDYINALVSQAQAIINSNISQAQMLHDAGVISVDKLCSQDGQLQP